MDQLKDILEKNLFPQSNQLDHLDSSKNPISPFETISLVMDRINNLETFNGFKIDDSNHLIITALFEYFSNSGDFIDRCKPLNISNPSLDKGILLAGNFGTGKTWLMKLFTRNYRQVFHIRNAKVLANAYQDGQEGIDYTNKHKNPVNDREAFYQPYAGLCIDDIGTEDIKTNYGNRKNVIGDLIEQRYSKGNTGIFLHATTNLNAQELKEFYGERVTSRMREIFNFIEVAGNDRRK